MCGKTCVQYADVDFITLIVCQLHQYICIFCQCSCLGANCMPIEMFQIFCLLCLSYVIPKKTFCEANHKTASELKFGRRTFFC